MARREMTYDDTYNGLHGHLDRQVRETAAVIAPALARIVQPKSVIDIGCGSGIWLSAFNGVSVTGMDGDYIDRGSLHIPRERFFATDLTKPFTAEPHDLALCLEVAEHIPAVAADGLVDSLTHCSPVIYFSAAIPGQGGMGHVNEQWPSYWRAKFHDRGYVAFDIIRRQFWNDDRVLYWYSQNALLYVRAEAIVHYPALAEQPREFVSDMIHPRRYLTLDRTARAGEAPSLGFLAKSIPGAVSRFVKGKLGMDLKLREPSHGG